MAYASSFTEDVMILLSRLNKENFLVNSDLIEFVEETPNTVISMVSGRKFVVSESRDEVVQRIIGYKREIISEKSLDRS